MSVVIEQRIATLLGNLGLLPFFMLALLCWPWTGAALPRLQLALVGYAAVILSFLGAVHWGLALANPGLNKAQSWNVLGWLALLMLVLGMPAVIVFVFLIGDLLLVRVVDGLLVRLYATPVAGWYLALRTRLTLAAAACLLIAAAGAFPR